MGEGVLQTDRKIIEKLEILLEQNEKLAQGILTVADMLKEKLSDSFLTKPESTIDSTINDSQQSSGLMQTVPDSMSVPDSMPIDAAQIADEQPNVLTSDTQDNDKKGDMFLNVGLANMAQQNESNQQIPSNEQLGQKLGQVESIEQEPGMPQPMQEPGMLPPIQEPGMPQPLQ